MPVVRTDGRAVRRCTVTWLPNYLGWVVYHIFLPMVLCCSGRELRYYYYYTGITPYTGHTSLDNAANVCQGPVKQEICIDFVESSGTTRYTTFLQPTTTWFVARQAYFVGGKTRKTAIELVSQQLMLQIKLHIFHSPFYRTFTNLIFLNQIKITRYTQRVRKFTVYSELSKFIPLMIVLTFFPGMFVVAHPLS